jgi:hypothetical protein
VEVLLRVFPAIRVTENANEAAMEVVVLAVH